METLASLIDLAILAPSTHNTQPWKFTVRDKEIIIAPELARALPIGDPQHRELFISLGCTLENIMIASDYYGYATSVNYVLEKDLKQSSITVLFSQKNDDQAESDDRLILAMRNRHSSRDPYLPTTIEDSFLNWIKTLGDDQIRIDVISDQVKKELLADVVSNAEVDSLSSKVFRRELATYLTTASSKSPTGIVVPGPVPFLMKYFNLAKLGKKKMDKALKIQTPAMIVISTRDDNARSWIAVGQKFERIALEATSRGIVMGPLAAPIETGDYYKKLQHILSTDFRPQFFSRMGMPSKPSLISRRLEVGQVIH